MKGVLVIFNRELVVMKVQGNLRWILVALCL